MRILEVNKFYYHKRGAERHFLDVINLFQKEGHEVRVFSMAHPQNLETPDAKFFPSFVAYNSGEGTVWEKIKGIGRLFYSFEAKTKMHSLLHEWQPEIVHLHNIYHQLSPSILGPLRTQKIPIIMTVHDYNLISPDKDRYYPEVAQAYYRFLSVDKYSLGKRLLLVIKKYFEDCWNPYQTVDLFLVPSELVKNTFVEAGFYPEKFHVVPHFISGVENSQMSDIQLPALPEKFAFSFGSLSLDKGTSMLIKLFEDLHYPLVLAGQCAPGYQLPISSNTHYVGVQNKDQIEVIIKKAEFVVGASTLPETFGLVPLETIALGKPFIGLKTGAYGEIINNTNGYLADDTVSLEDFLGRLIRGEVLFDATVIKTDAHRRFSADRYNQDFWALVGQLKSK